MAKKSDILLKYYNDFPAFLEDYKNRSEKLERDFLRAKNDYQSYLDKIDEMFHDEETELAAKYLQIELFHQEQNRTIEGNYSEQFKTLSNQVDSHNQDTNKQYSEEDETYQNILNQFEERKAEAFNIYLQLTKETNYRIDKEMRVHHDFIGEEKEKLNAKKIEYQDLNSSLSNKLLWTMEKAKNALQKLSSTLNEQGEQNKAYLDETINDSLSHLNNSREAMMALFKTSSLKYEKERNSVRSISKDKRKPHSDLNQQMIATFVKQIKDVNINKASFDKMIKNELELSLSRIYPKIIEADANNQTNELEKYILQKEIIQKKAEYLLNRNQNMSDLLISKYQNEIKKIKIDSFKRFEEIKTAYSVPAAFFQNSVNVYSNFAFYLNETYEDLSRMLHKFKQYNQDFIKYKTDYIHTSQKTFEDYKINLLVKVNDITNHLTEYISRIDELSHQIVTLESNNRLEIAEIRKKMENLDVFGDYQKFIAHLENDQELAIHQHNKNIQRIQIDSNYTTSLLEINGEVLQLNQNKLDHEEYQRYMLEVSTHEQKIIELNHKKRIEEAKAKYQQQIDQVVALRELARNQIIYNAKKTNYGYASAYVNYLDSEAKKNQIGSERVIDFVHHVQNLIDLNTQQTKKIDEFIKNSHADNAYLRALEENRLALIKQIDKTTKKKNQICETACTIYETDISNTQKQFHRLFTKYIDIIKDNLLLLQSLDVNVINSTNHSGYKNEITSLMNYAYKKTLSLAYKYQIPQQIISIEKAFEEFLGKYLFTHITIFDNIKKSKNNKKTKELLQSYYVQSYELLNTYLEYIDNALAFILAKTTANDRAFIDNTESKAERNKAIINKEYEKLEFYAVKYEKNHKRQLRHFQEYSNRLNDIYKKQVSVINYEYLNKVKESETIGKEIYKDFIKIVNKNNKELDKMVNFMEKMFNKEQAEIEKQYTAFKKTLSVIESERESFHIQEIAYINTTYQNKQIETTKTMEALEKRISKLPIEKEDQFLAIKKEKYQLQALKAKTIQKDLAKIEKEKFVSRPKYMAEIEEVKNRLPDDYLSLYNAVQKLEFEFLNQFSEINEKYNENYRDYILNQSGNNELIEPNSPLYQAFDDLHRFNTKSLNQTNDTYKETYNKSQKARQEFKKEQAKSKQRQDRIING